MKRAFSLLEILVVLAITAVVMALGTYSLLSFRNFTQVQNGYTNLVSLLKQQQNKAKNSISSEAKRDQSGSILDSIPDFYALSFTENKYSLYYCDKVGNDRVNCFIENSQSIDQREFNSIEIQLECEGGLLGLAFEKLSGDIIGFDESGNFTSLGVCDITIGHVQFGSQRTIQVNLTENNIKVE